MKMTALPFQILLTTNELRAQLAHTRRVFERQSQQTTKLDLGTYTSNSHFNNLFHRFPRNCLSNLRGFESSTISTTHLRKLWSQTLHP
jgi:hypothetical protein